jgi:hypothetical protein
LPTFSISYSSIFLTSFCHLFLGLLLNLLVPKFIYNTYKFLIHVEMPIYSCVILMVTFLYVRTCTIRRGSRLCTYRCLQIMHETTLYGVATLNMMTV